MLHPLFTEYVVGVLLTREQLSAVAKKMPEATLRGLQYWPAEMPLEDLLTAAGHEPGWVLEARAELQRRFSLDVVPLPHDYTERYTRGPVVCVGLSCGRLSSGGDGSELEHVSEAVRTVDLERLRDDIRLMTGDEDPTVHHHIINLGCHCCT